MAHEAIPASRDKMEGEVDPMAVREIIKGNTGIVAGIAIIATLVAGYFIVRQVSARPSGQAQDALYTNDDGRTWFRDSVSKFPPFKTSEGKDAVLAHVFSCKGKEFVGFMEKYTPEYQTELQKAAEAKDAGKSPTNTARIMALRGTGRLMKKPGGKDWTVYSDAVWMSILCDDKTVPEPVMK